MTTALVQTAATSWAAFTQGSAKTITLPSAATVGNMVFVRISYSHDAINSVTGLGGTWTLLQSREPSTNQFESAEIWYCTVATASTTITITPNPSFSIDGGSAIANEVSGLTGAVSASSTVSSHSNANTRTSPSLAASAEDLAIVVITHENNAAPNSYSGSPGSWTLTSQTNYNGGGGSGSWMVTGLHIATGSETPQLTASWSVAADGLIVAAVFSGVSSNVTEDIPTATGTGDAPAPTITVSGALDVPAATGTADASAPSVAITITEDVPAATGTASAPAPSVVVYADLTSWPASDSNGSLLDLTAGAVLTTDVPPVDPPPDGGWKRVSSIYHAPTTIIDGWPVNWTPDHVDTEDLGRLQVVVDGKDVSRFRGKRTQVGTWSSREAGGDEALVIRFPMITVFDHPGSGEVAWLHDGAHVGINRITPAGVVKHLWTGQYVSEQSDYDSTGSSYTAQCQGVCFGADRYVLPASVRNDIRDIGTVIPEVMNGCISRDWATMPQIVTGITTAKHGPAPERLSQFIAPILAEAVTSDGLDQYTLTNDVWRPVLKVKDRTTIHATMRAGQPGCKVSARRDALTGKKVIYGEGTRSDGMRFRNMKFPGARLTDPPLFPLDPGDHFSPGGPETGFAAFANEMRDNGHTMHSVDTYDARDEDEVRDEQNKGGLAVVDGNVGADTWAAVFGVGSDTSDLYGAYQAPMAIIREVDPWTYNARGEKTGPNPYYDPSILRIESYEDFGDGTSLALTRSSARGELNRTNLPQWSGTIVLTKDPNEISRFDLREGMNFLLQKHHQLDRQLHIAGCVVDWKAQTVTLTVDQLNRDLITLQEIRKRTRETETSRLRRVLPSRARQIIDTYTIWDGEAPTGRIPMHAAAAGRWVVLQVAAGQAGTIAKFRLTTSGPASEFAAGLFGRPVTASQLEHYVASPFDDARPWDANEAALQDLGIQAAWGGQETPAGYSPKTKGDTGATLTGKLIDDGGLSYATDYPGWLWIAYYVTTSCYIEGLMTPGVEGL